MSRGTDYETSASEQIEQLSWEKAPLWPPDLFAVAATIVRNSECYAHGDVRGGLGLGRRHPEQMRALGLRWAANPADRLVGAWVQRQWDTLLRHRDEEAGGRASPGGKLSPWAVAALSLLAVADEACGGVGFGSRTRVATFAREVSWLKEARSITWLANTGECCVQPKGRTPPVGCNLRSLSLHLALLPPTGEVNTVHIEPPAQTRRRLGVLLVPFPYVVADSDFQAKRVRGQHWGNVSLRFSWATRPSPRALARFVTGLISHAKSRGRRTDVVILPELALSWAQLDSVWAAIRRAGVSLLMSGVHERRNGSARNLAVGLLRGRSPFDDVQWVQSKHHRWRIEKWQIHNYGFRLAPDRSWWEDIDVRPRSVYAVRFTAGGTVSCVVCEDLARVEPVQPVLRDIGPSLLVALLMDGPQFDRRWSAKNSMVFAEDPGSSVLSVTSLALVRRNQAFRDKHEGKASPPIALWQEPDRSPEQIPLEPDAHAVHFVVRVTSQREVTLDGRDAETAEVFRLVRPKIGPAFTQIVHPTAPPWAVPLYRTHA